MFNFKRNFIVFITIFAALSLFGKTTKTNELRFQLGFGGFVNTSNLMGLIENAKMIEKINNSSSNPDIYGLTDEQKEAFGKISNGMQTAVIVANMLGGFEYGLKLRMLWHVIIADVDFNILPLDGSYNGRFDMMLSANLGVRAPFWIMPYATMGATFTFSFYSPNVDFSNPDTYKNADAWKNYAYGAFKNFVFRPGINTRLGLEFKFKGFSIGGYYQWTVKDFDEFKGFYLELVNNVGRDQASAVGTILGYQSRFGLDFVFYLF